MTIEQSETNVAAAIEAGKELAAQVLEVTDVDQQHVGSVLVTPENMRVDDLERFMPGPRRINQVVAAASATGFATYVQTFGDPARSVGFADADGRFGVILDYHLANRPSWNQHRVKYAPAMSPVFQAWSGMCGRPLTQVVLADFIQDHLGEIARPDASALLKLVQKFEITKDTAYSSAINSANGTVTFAYAENVKDAGAVEAPTELTLVLPVYDGEPAQNITVRFRYRVTDGKLSITLTMVRLDEIQRAARRAMAERIVAATKSHVRVWIEGVTD